MLYGRDAVWLGTDYAEDADGDLDELVGPEVPRQALVKRFLSDGLPWDPDYGLHPSDHVDGTATAAAEVAARAVQQARQDDRIERATASIVDADDGSDEVTVEVRPTLIGPGGGQPLDPIPIAVNS